MWKGDLDAAVEKIKGASSDKIRLDEAKKLIASNCLSCDQVNIICQQFNVENARLILLKQAYPKTTDPGNFSRLYPLLKTDKVKKELEKFVEGK